MASFSTLQTSLPALFATLLGIPCDWADQPRGLHPSARAELAIFGETALGMDERRWQTVPGGTEVEDTVQATVTGQRLFTLSITAWSPSQKLDESARFYLERLRLRLSFPSTVATLDGLGLGLIDTLPIHKIDPDENARRVSMAVLDVRLSHAQSESDAPIESINEAHVLAQYVTHADGTHAGAQPDLQPEPS